jgi:hypothetical protein
MQSIPDSPVSAQPKKLFRVEFTPLFRTEMLMFGTDEAEVRERLVDVIMSSHTGYIRTEGRSICLLTREQAGERVHSVVEVEQ